MGKYWVIVVVALFVFTGCVKGDLHATVHKDGAAEVDFTFLIDGNYLAVLPEEDNPLVQMKAKAEAEGYRVTHVKEGAYAGLRMQKQVENVSELNGDQVLAMGEGQARLLEVTEDKGFFYSTYRAAAALNLDDMAQLVSGFDPSSPVAKMFVNKVDFQYRLTVPEEAVRHNAARSGESVEVAGEEEGKGITYEWDLIPGQSNRIELEAKVWHWQNVSLSAAGAAGVLLVAALRLMRRETENGEVQAT